MFFFVAKPFPIPRSVRRTICQVTTPSHHGQTARTTVRPTCSGPRRICGERAGTDARTDEAARKAAMADLQAILKTNKGDITVNLFPNHAPATVENFVGLAEGDPGVPADDAGRSRRALLRRPRLPPGHRRTS